MPFIECSWFVRLNRFSKFSMAMTAFRSYIPSSLTSSMVFGICSICVWICGILLRSAAFMKMWHVALYPNWFRSIVMVEMVSRFFRRRLYLWITFFVDMFSCFAMLLNGVRAFCERIFAISLSVSSR